MTFPLEIVVLHHCKQVQIWDHIMLLKCSCKKTYFLSLFPFQNFHSCVN